MSINYGRNSRRIGSFDINLLTVANGTVVSSGEDSYGGYFIKFQIDSAGCGAPNSRFSIELKDQTPWTNISYEAYNEGTASCWDFNAGGAFGLGNLLAYNSSIDTISRAVNCFELPQFAKKMSACDNNSDNFMHNVYAVGTFRSFFVTRRRNLTTSLVNLNFERSCNSTGTGSFIIVRNIFVW